MKKNIGRILIIMACFMASSQAFAALTLGLDLTEGGRLSSTAISQFEKYMTQQACEIKVLTKNVIESDIYFSAQLNNPKRLLSYHSLMKANAIDNRPLTMSILIKSSTNLEDLSSVQGERLAIISHNSYLGGDLGKKLLTDAGIKLITDKIYETGDYFGAMSLLLHGDVFIAAIPGPLAKKWQIHNKLTIIAESEVLYLGELLFKPSIPEPMIERCIKAFSSLAKVDRRDKKMSIFPAWLGGFQVSE